MYETTAPSSRVTIMYPHRIRLRGPWAAEPVGDAGAPTRQVTLPCRWADLRLDNIGAVVFRRRFGLPRRLDDWERVWLTCARVDGRSDWHLNGAGVAMRADPAGGLEADVTVLLRERNELTVRVERNSPDCGLYGEVALEVRCRAYLHGVRSFGHCVAAGWQVRVTGVVVREHPDDPLELYLLIDGKSHDYRRVQGDESETPFLLTAPVEPKPAGEPMTVRVDLVSGATIWHTTEMNFNLVEESER
jgi:hypothetical protein